MSSLRAQGSYFDLLPAELLVHICAYIPPHSLFSIASVCKKLQDICTHLIYADPLSVVSPKPHKTRTAYRKLVHLIDTRPHLQARLRKLKIYLPDISTSDVLNAAPFRWEDTQHLTEIRLYVPPICAECRSMQRQTDFDVPCHRLVQEVLAIAATKWPNLPSLHIERDATLVPCHCSTNNRINPGFFPSLRNLRIDNQPLNPTTTVHLLAISSSSLHSLTLESPHDLLQDIMDALPIFPALEHLNISLKSPDSVIQAVLPRCFPNLTSLRLKHCGWRSFDGCIPLDLSSLLFLQHLYVSSFEIDRLPAGLKTWTIADTFLLPRSGLHSLEKVCFHPTDPLCLEDRRRGACEWFRLLGEHYPMLTYLEAGGTLVRIRERDLVSCP